MIFLWRTFFFFWDDSSQLNQLNACCTNRRIVKSVQWLSEFSNWTTCIHIRMYIFSVAKRVEGKPTLDEIVNVEHLLPYTYMRIYIFFIYFIYEYFLYLMLSFQIHCLLHRQQVFSSSFTEMKKLFIMLYIYKK